MNSRINFTKLLLVVFATLFSVNLPAGADCPVYLPGDINSDCYVNLLDMAEVASHWLECYDQDNPQCQRPADFVGACCNLSTGQCENMELNECYAFYSERWWLGENSSCLDCSYWAITPGACCDWHSGDCAEMRYVDCTATYPERSWYGPGSTCGDCIARPEHALLYGYAYEGPWDPTTSTTFVDIPNAAGYISTEAEGDLAITFSARIYVTDGKRIFVRALIDGTPASPSDVIMNTVYVSRGRSFTFVREDLPAGDHTVQMQWLVDSGGTASIGDRSLTLFSASPATQNGRVFVTAAPSAGSVSTTANYWQDVPDLSQTVTTDEDGSLAMTVTAESYTNAGCSVFYRVLLNGAPTSPSDVLFSIGGYNGTSAFTFVKENVSAGFHDVRVQWMVSIGGTAFAGDRTLTTRAAPEPTWYGGLFVKAAPSGPDVSTISPSWVNVPNMDGVFEVTMDTQVEITFSAEAKSPGGQRVFIRALIDGQSTHPGNVVLVNETYTNTLAFTFVTDNLAPGLHTVQMQWMIDSGGTGFMGDRTLAVNHW